MTRILIVDDNTQLLRSFKRILGRYQVEVETVPSYDDANNILCKVVFDVVLSDYDLQDPDGRTGVDLLERIDPERTRRILMSGTDLNSLPISRIRKLDKFVAKPFSLLDLARELGLEKVEP